MTTFPVLAALGAGLRSPAARGRQTTARLSYHWGPSQSAIMSKKLADEVTRRSGGRLKVDVFLSGQLYTIRQIIGACPRDRWRWAAW
jgi:TRAP-type C4-dicarboxylate transport system substrate-binding protein